MSLCHCSTIPRLLSLRMTEIIGSFSSTAVARACSVMTKLPSPSKSTTGTSGAANFAPTAAGSPKPIVPRPVEVIQVLGLRTLIVYLAPHLVPSHARGQYRLGREDVSQPLDYPWAR